MYSLLANALRNTIWVIPPCIIASWADKSVTETIPGTFILWGGFLSLAKGGALNIAERNLFWQNDLLQVALSTADEYRKAGGSARAQYDVRRGEVVIRYIASRCPRCTRVYVTPECPYCGAERKQQ
jgi:hypothetical protein